jgi:hypothetical protein
MDEGPRERLAAARALLPGVRLAAADHLGGNDRCVVDRVRARWPDGTESSLIVKCYHFAGEGWVRESAALAVLPAAVRAPHVVAAGSAPPVLVVEDLGDGASVADALLGDDPDAAEAALGAWASALAALHAATRGSRPAFRAALAERRGDLPVGESRVPVDLEEAVRVLDRACTNLDVRVPAGAFDELRGLAKRLGGSGLAALTPADACPDNNVLTAAGLVLVDFEGAQWRHIAWDVAYLRVPWPSCWCSWRLPDDVADRAVTAYVRAAAPQIPEVEAESFGRDVEAACVGWALVSTSWFVDNALGTDPPLNPDRPTPTRRAMILHRLDLAARAAELPAAGRLADRLADVLRDRWGAVPLALAPAFRAAQ